MRYFRLLCVGIVPALLLAVLSGCGQKGALYRPDEPADKVENTSVGKDGPTFPAPQAQKERRSRNNSRQSSSATEPPAADPDRPASPSPGT
jgi:predicted small lipoprotein YifL